MIYADTSVLLAKLFAEPQSPPDAFWNQPLVSSRLTEYEVWNRVHARKIASSHGEAAKDLLGRLAIVEMTPVTLARALEPYSQPLRTLDGLHLATIHFLHTKDPGLAVATYDSRLADAVRQLKIKVVSPGSRRPDG